MIDCRIAQVGARMDEALPHVIVCQVVEVLGSEGCGIDGLIAAVCLADDMPLNKLHPLSPALVVQRQSAPSCVWRGVGRTDGQ